MGERRKKKKKTKRKKEKRRGLHGVCIKGERERRKKKEGGKESCFFSLVSQNTGVWLLLVSVFLFWARLGIKKPPLKIQHFTKKTMFYRFVFV